MSKHKSFAVVACVLLVAACSDQPVVCPTSYAAGEWVQDRISGERYIVVQGEPFTNLFSGRCALLVETKNGQWAISSYRVEKVGQNG